MAQRGRWVTAVLVLLAGGGIGWSAQATSATSARDWNATWQLDAARSDKPEFGRRGGPAGGRFEGRRHAEGDVAARGEAQGARDGRRDARGGDESWQKRPGPGGARPDGRGGRRFGGRGGRRGMLPERMTTERVGSTLRFEDEQGNVLEEIGPGSRSANREGGPQHAMRSAWKGDVLQIERSGERGAMTQTFQLEDGGRTLVVQTKRPGLDGQPARDFRRVYRRVGS